MFRFKLNENVSLSVVEDSPNGNDDIVPCPFDSAQGDITITHNP
ncbi:hypothetical protein [Dyadobacter sp. 50-39]|nr:hypothetical protein [Dyadobacter sp. 50-39]